jgi:hypothetical protein
MSSCSRLNCLNNVCPLFECLECKRGVCMSCIFDFESLLIEKKKEINCNKCHTDFGLFCFQCQLSVWSSMKEYGCIKNMTESDFLKRNFHFCDCANKDHCLKPMRKQIKENMCISLTLNLVNKNYFCNDCVESKKLVVDIEFL